MPLVRTVQCRQCGGRTKITRGKPDAVCIHCGTLVKLSDAVLQEQQMAARFPPMSPLRLGMKGTYRGKEWELCGRQVCRQVDEGEVYTWEEYLLAAPDGDVLYLEYDEGKWKISEPFVPDRAYSPGELQVYREGSRLTLDGHQRLVSDAGQYEIVFAEGDFPWMIVPGRKTHFLDASFGSQFHCVEWTDEEMEYYRGQYLDERQIFTVFGLRHLIARLDHRLKTLRSRQLFGAWCLALGVLCGAVWISTFAAGHLAPNGSGETDAIQVGQEGKRFGPISLTKVGRVHRLEISARLREGSCWLQAVLEDENEQELMAADRDMWDESGTDSDGYWHEADVNTSTSFVLVKPGNYYVRLYSEPEANTQGVTAPTIASFRLFEESLYGLWVGLACLLLSLTGFGFLAAGSPAAVGKVWQSMKEADDD